MDARMANGCISGGALMSFDPDRLDARDPEFIRAVLPLAAVFNKHYLSLKRDGLENIPKDPALFVGNHNGGITGPDLICTMGTLLETLGPDAPLYALAHDFAMRQFTPLGRFVQLFGGMRACPENAQRVFDAGGQALVYPGGDIEAYRHSRLRDRIIFGSRTGFVRVAQRAGVPIVPIVVHGAHRSAYIFHDGEFIARAFKVDEWGRTEKFPLALALPWGIAAGPWTPYLPLPFPIRLRVLPPVQVAPDDDPAEVRENVRSMMQAALDSMAGEARNAR
jgi:1-acyl-sn-glycerol-3-phosphate acyltransferase